MRTTLNIDDDVYETACAMAKNRKTSVGKVLSDMVRETLNRPVWIEYRNGWPVFVSPPGSQPISHEAVQRFLDEEGHF